MTHIMFLFQAAVLDRIIEAVNDDGALDVVKSAKILAGKEPEMTSLVSNFSCLPDPIS